MTEQIEIFVEGLITFGLGIAFLLFGRRLFWILGGLAIAVVGALLATFILEPSMLAFTIQNEHFGFNLEAGRSIQSVIIVTLIAGLIGIFLTIRFPKLASAIVGFVGGAFLLFGVYILFAFTPVEWVRRATLIIAGTIVAIFALRQPAATMIVLSSILGANIILDAFRLDLNSPLSAFVWLIAMLIGIVFQQNALRIQLLKAAARTQAMPPASPPVNI